MKYLIHFLLLVLVISCTGCGLKAMHKRHILNKHREAAIATSKQMESLKPDVYSTKAERNNQQASVRDVENRLELERKTRDRIYAKYHRQGLTYSVIKTKSDYRDSLKSIEDLEKEYKVAMDLLGKEDIEHQTAESKYRGAVRSLKYSNRVQDKILRKGDITVTPKGTEPVVPRAAPSIFYGTEIDRPIL